MGVSKLRRMRQRQCKFVRQRRQLIRQIPFGSSPANNARYLATSKRSSRKASTSERTGSMASSASESRLR